MIKSRHGTGFTIETFERGWITGSCRRQDLHGGTSAHELMLAEVNARHASGRNSFQHLVFADRKATPATLEKVLCLEVSQYAVAKHEAGQLGRVSRERAGAAQTLYISVQIMFFENTT